VTLNYQWLRNGSIIPGATGTSLLLHAGDVGKDISVQVTGSKIGFVSATRTSSAIFVPVATVTLTPVPTITGTVQIGNTLTANSGVWDTGMTLSYQWLRNGSIISGATGSSYGLKLADAGQSISVRITGSKTGFKPVTVSSSVSRVPLQNLVLTPVPTISGSVQVGEQLTAVPGVWDSGVTLSYQWLRNGSSIFGATGASYRLTLNDDGQSISVRITGSKTGFNPVTVISSALSSVPLQNLVLTPVPTISGSAQVGERLYAVPGVWDSGVTFSYQWLRNVSIIPGVTGDSYRLTLSDVGQSISVQVTGSKAGFRAVTANSVSIPAVAHLTLTPVPAISGSAQVGAQLTAVPGVWDSGVTFTYQWLRNGSIISGATGASYGLTLADAGEGISVRVTGSKTGFNPVTVTSSVSGVARQNLVLTPVPTISGSAQVGNKLTIVTGVWDSGVKLTCIWLRNGSSFKDSTCSSYVLTLADAGQSISVRIIGSKTGFNSVTVTSSALSSVSLQNLILTPTPTISGSAQRYEQLTAVPGVWDSGVTLSYQWLRNGSIISGATGASYVLTLADAGQSISVQVTGSKAGFKAVTANSILIPVAGSLTLTSVPTISGSVQVGAQLTAVPGVWDSGVTFSYQWLRNGSIISGATGAIYGLTLADAGQIISLQVTGSKTGFTAVTVSGDVRRVPLQNLILTPVPTISGSAQVGEQLTVVPGVWDSGVTLDYQWFRNGSIISGAKGVSYTLTLDNAGKSISVRITGSKTGFNPVTVTSSALISVPLQNLILTPTPTISGSAQVDAQLTAVPGVWDSGVTLSYQWLRNGSIIPGAVDSRFLLSQQDAGQQISVRILGRKLFFSSISLDSQTIGIPELGQFPNLATAYIDCSGQCRVGSLAKAVTTGFYVGTVFEYKWYRQNLGESVRTLVSSNPDWLINKVNQLGVVVLEVTAKKIGYRDLQISKVIYPAG
jgi:hypothetical protein